MYRIDWSKDGTFHVKSDQVQLGWVKDGMGTIYAREGGPSLWSYVDEDQAARNGWHVSERAALEWEMADYDRQATGYRRRAEACERALAAAPKKRTR